MKGIILAAGKGTRLYPASLPISKILLTVYDKPMIYYPLATLMQAGIRDILIVTNDSDIDNFKKVLGNGSQYGIRLSYKIQMSQRGIADALLVAEEFIAGAPCALVLGDNLFYGISMPQLLKKTIRTNTGATIFGYAVKDPERFGVVEFDENKKAISLEEKPKHPKSNYAVTGLYFYDGHACEYAKTLLPSARGELEITDLNRIYLEQKTLRVERLERGVAWLDTGTHDSMLQAGVFVQAMELNTGRKIACLEEIAYEQGFISASQLLDYLQGFKNNGYYDYIRDIVLQDVQTQ
ncbi:MAG: glucose-1-phosphate thymidylyltransferase RfbA [Oxalobacter sp.]|nr:glucose-1-phosphate thymidylyltransferase RfbA [Oxalobacter sp.]